VVNTFRLEAAGVQQIVLEEAASLICFGIGLGRQLAVRSIRQLHQAILERTG
jgi:hypothetical protein